MRYSENDERIDLDHSDGVLRLVAGLPGTTGGAKHAMINANCTSIHCVDSLGLPVSVPFGL